MLMPSKIITNPQRLSELAKQVKNLNTRSIAPADVAIQIFNIAVDSGAFAMDEFLSLHADIAAIKRGDEGPWNNNNDNILTHICSYLIREPKSGYSETFREEFREWGQHNLDFKLEILAKALEAEVMQAAALAKSQPPAPGSEPSGKAGDGGGADNAAFTPSDLATKFAIPLESVKKALANWRKINAGGDGYIENPDARKNQPQFLYKLREVKPTLERLKSLRERRQIARKK